MRSELKKEYSVTLVGCHFYMNTCVLYRGFMRMIRLCRGSTGIQRVEKHCARAWCKHCISHKGQGGTAKKKKKQLKPNQLRIWLAKKKPQEFVWAIRWDILLFSTCKHPVAALIGRVVMIISASVCVCVPYETPVAAELLDWHTGECWMDGTGGCFPSYVFLYNSFIW